MKNTDVVAEHPLSRVEIAFYLALIAVGIGLRFYRLETFVPVFDMVSDRYVVLLQEILGGQHWFPRGPVHCEYDETIVLYLVLPFVKLFGSQLLVYRILAAAFSLSLLPAVHFFARTIATQRVAWIATVFTSSSLWFIQSAHLFHRMRYDLGVACGLVSVALLLGHRKQPVWSALLAGILAGIGLYLHASNAVLVITSFIVIIFKFMGNKPVAVKQMAAFSVVFIAIFHTGWALRDTQNLKVMHLIRSNAIRRGLKASRAATAGLISKNKPETHHYPIKPPVLKVKSKNPAAVFLYNFSRIPMHFVIRPMQDYMGRGPRLIHNALLGGVIGIGVCLLVFRRFRQSQSIVMGVFINWLVLQSIMKLRPIESEYYNVGVIMSIIFAGLTLTALQKRLPPRARLPMLLGFVMLIGSWDIIRADYHLRHPEFNQIWTRADMNAAKLRRMIPHQSVVDNNPLPTHMDKEGIEELDDKSGKMPEERYQ